MRLIKHYQTLQKFPTVSFQDTSNVYTYNLLTVYIASAQDSREPDTDTRVTFQHGRRFCARSLVLFPRLSLSRKGDCL